MIRAAVPGVNPDDVEVTIEGSAVTIRGEAKPDQVAEGATWLVQEHRFGSFARTIELGMPVQADKADAKKIEWMSWIGGPSLDILSKHLDEAASTSLIPYAPTMSQYITADEAKTRYDNLKAWYTAHGHFWEGTGPYYLDKVFLTEKTLTLKPYADFPDLADRLNVSLYATYLSYLEESDFAYSLSVRTDARGSLAEFVSGSNILFVGTLQ